MLRLPILFKVTHTLVTSVYRDVILCFGAHVRPQQLQVGKLTLDDYGNTCMGRSLKDVDDYLNVKLILSLRLPIALIFRTVGEQLGVTEL